MFFRGVSTGAIGALQGMLDAYLDYGKKRIQRTSGVAGVGRRRDPAALRRDRVAIDEMKTILHRNFQVLEGYAARGEMPPLKQRVEYKFHNAVVAERCSLLASRLFKAAGTAGIAPTCRSGGFSPTSPSAGSTSPTSSSRLGQSYGAFLFGIETTRTLCSAIGRPAADHPDPHGDRL